MKLIYFFFILTAIYACNGKPVSKSRIIANPEEKKIDGVREITMNSIALKTSKIYRESWQEYENHGSGDTALTLYAFRILYTKNQSQKDDCQSRANLIIHKEKVISIATTLFKGMINLDQFVTKLDSLNHQAIRMAWDEIKLDRKKYGALPEKDWGPCDYLYSFKDSL